MMSNTDQQIGIDIGGTHLRVGIVRDGAVVSCGVYRSAEVFASGHAADALVSLIRRYSDTAGGSVQAVSIGIPGSVCNDHRTIYCTPNLFASDGSHLFEKLCNQLPGLRAQPWIKSKYDCAVITGFYIFKDHVQQRCLSAPPFSIQTDSKGRRLIILQ